MKRTSILSLVICLLLPIAVFTPAAGCKSSSTQSKAVTTMFTIGSGVDEAYKAYLDLIVMGSVSTNSLPSVSQKYMLFQQAFAAGIELTAGNTNAPVPTSVLNAATEFNKAVVTAEGGN